ncbi:MAG: triose-phosphate isomerase [Nanoarchaeota archaeon]|nr:triose-phosphate isomerase [Nanoarchaeota archaeon]
MVLVVNFKNYKFGNEAVKLAKECKKVSKNIVLGVGIAELYRIVKETNMKCYVQHVDSKEKGRNTGYVIPEAVKANGGKGVMLNHSEHRIKDIKESVRRCKNLGLETLVFVKNIREGKKVSKLKPSYVCIELPKLIAGKVSISESKPGLIEKAVKKIKSKVLVGAGIHNRNDIIVAKNLGAKGVVVSSAVTKNKNPKKILEELKW